ncbi:MAG: dTDP-4-dehydrorhamnose reductase [Syntrophaceae bacterium PtaU1.Bin231]|nr:MAG: dTDP-4-dehydrorhamnose reductase [Syntrophaceae bacterium PtaU1.Bin231]
MERTKVLILGGTGMLGHVLFRHLSRNADYDVYATARNLGLIARFFPPVLAAKFRPDSVDADNFDTVIRALASIQPAIVINCIGMIKQQPMASDPLTAITVNAQLPHRISLISRNAKARMIHISTDCVFDGKKGMYTEDDVPSAEDLYGRTKLLGEVSYSHCVTLRTSIIGHELKGRYGLIEWFLGQTGRVRGYKNAIYSGFPTIELARIISDHVLPNRELSGIYHVSSAPISKYDLLKMVAGRYGKQIEIEPYEDFVVDRSLNSNRFRSRTGYSPPSWAELIDGMYRDYEANKDLQYRDIAADATATGGQRGR